MGNMKNNEYNFSDQTFEVQDASSFVAVMSGALLPDAMIAHYSEETPWFVKRAVEMLFFQGRELSELDPTEAADAFYINALVALQRDMKSIAGEADWDGMLNAYLMPDNYKAMFQNFAAVGFTGAYAAIKNQDNYGEQKQEDISPWEQRGINLN